MTSSTTQTTDVTEHSTTRSVTKHYTVSPPAGRNHDTLWDIADRTLGNPLRYKEIYELNSDRPQADGRTLQNANLILPGWQLHLPADAHGPGVETVTHTTPVTHTRTVQSEHTVTGASSVIAESQSSAASGSAVITPASHGRHVELEHLALGGGLLLAGLAVAFAARRGPYAEVTVKTEALAADGDPALAALLDRCLRSLAAGRREQARELPEAVVAWVSSDRIALHFAGGDVTDPPAPWRKAEEPATWTVDPSQVGGSADAAVPFPALVPIGTNHGFEVFVDLEQAPGLVSVAGDTDIARQVVLTAGVQLATSLWSDGARITFVGFADGDELAGIDPDRMSSVNGLDEVIESLEADAETLRLLQQQLRVDGVLAGRQSLAGRDARWHPRLLVLSGPPTPVQGLRLQELIGSGRGNLIVLSVGDAPSARWRFTATAAGAIDLGVLGTTVQAHLLTSEGTRELLGAFREADTDRAGQTLALDDPSGPTPTAPEGARLPRLAHDRAAVHVCLLGPVAVQTPGVVDPAKRELLTELVVAVAVSDGGLHDAVLRASVWPRGAGDDAVEGALADAQAWLGRSIDGSERLRRDVDGRWRLSSDVWTDWDDLRTRAGSVDDRSLDELQAALGLVSGEVFSQTSAGRYGWLAFVRSARDARLLVTLVARRVSRSLLMADRRSDAAAALRRGLDAVPTSEVMWRDLLTLMGTDGPAAAASVAEEMYAALGSRARWAEPQTDALVAQLAPDYHRARRREA